MGTRDVMNTASESSMQKCSFKVTSLPTLTQFYNHKKSLLAISFVNFTIPFTLNRMSEFILA